MRLFKCVGGADVFWPLDPSEHPSLSSLENECDLPSSVSDAALDIGSPQKSIK